MKILLAIDGSPCSRVAVEEACRHRWPAGSTLKVLSVIHVRGPESGDPLFLATSFHFDMLAEARKHAPKLVEEVAETIMGRFSSVSGGPTLADRPAVVTGRARPMLGMVGTGFAWMSSGRRRAHGGVPARVPRIWAGGLR